MGGRVIVAVRQLAGDGHADRLVGASFRRRYSGGWSDRWGCWSYRLSDDVGQPDGRGRMVYRWSDGDGQSDGWTGMTDRLAVAWMDSVTDLRVGRQTVGAGRMTDGLVARQTDVLKDGRVMRQMYRRSGWGEGARWGCKATYSLLRVGGPLDWCRRFLGSVESCRCNWAAKKHI